jgi:ParB family transcriptional regulator, chromosome partitioning protein
MLDVDLVEQLVAQKLESEAAKVRSEGWAWVEHGEDLSSERRRQFRAIEPNQPARSEDEPIESGDLGEKLMEIESIAEEDLTKDDRKRLAAIESRLAEFDARLDVYSDVQKAKAGRVRLDRSQWQRRHRRARLYASSRFRGPAAPRGGRGLGQ